MLPFTIDSFIESEIEYNIKRGGIFIAENLSSFFSDFSILIRTVSARIFTLFEGIFNKQKEDSCRYIILFSLLFR